MQLFDVALGNWYGEPGVVRPLADLRQALALEFNGDLYSCDHFVEPGIFAGQHR